MPKKKLKKQPKPAFYSIHPTSLFKTFENLSVLLFQISSQATEAIALAAASTALHLLSFLTEKRTPGERLNDQQFTLENRVFLESTMPEI